MRARSESGYALLFIFAMAAIVALLLFRELPRAAFEAQRDKEQLLIDRGEQYSRAVTLFVRKFNRYPPDLDALNNTQNLRFLRNRYVDPMTGKSEWRLIHVGPGGVFIDSLVYGKKKDDSKAADQQNFITEMQQTGGTQVDANQAVNLAARTRPSDQPGAAGDPNNPQSNLPPPQAVPTDPSLASGFQPGVPQPGLNQPGLPSFDANGQAIPGTGTQQLQQSPFPGQPGTSLPGLPGVPVPPGVQLPPGVNQTGQQGQTPVPPSAGASLINQLLTSPRPGGLPGLNAAQQQPTVDQYGNPVPANPLNGAVNPTTAAPAQAATPQVVGGGIAGVASKREQEGIKVYGDRKKYNEWEFVYDVSKDPSKGGGAAVPQPSTGQQQGQQQAAPQSQQPTQPPQPAPAAATTSQ